MKKKKKKKRKKEKKEEASRYENSHYQYRYFPLVALQPRRLINQLKRNCAVFLIINYVFQIRKWILQSLSSLPILKFKKNLLPSNLISSSVHFRSFSHHVASRVFSSVFSVTIARRKQEKRRASSFQPVWNLLTIKTWKRKKNRIASQIAHDRVLYSLPTLACNPIFDTISRH